MEAYINGLSKEDRESVKEGKGLRIKTFKFGGEKSIQSRGKLELPCVLFGKKTKILADVVDREIPLLIPRPEMQKRGFQG